MNNPNSSHSIYDTTIRLSFLIFIIAWCLMIMYPFLHIILWSLILALAIFPLHRHLRKKIGGKPKLASFIIILSFLVIIILPSTVLLGSLFDEVKDVKLAFDNGKLTIPAPTEKVKEWPVIGEKLYGTWQKASVNLEQIIIQYKDQLVELGSKSAKGILGAVSDLFQILAALIFAGVLLAVSDVGEAIRKFFRKIAGDRGDEFADVTIKIVANVVKGVIGVAIIVALIHGVLFALAGIPYFGIWTLIVLVLGILQIPAAILTLPIAVYLFTVKEPMSAIVWIILLLAAGLCDNFLKPVLLGQGAPVPMLVIFTGVIGGFILSGFIGLFTGAIVMSIGYRLFLRWINSDEAGV